MKGLLPLFAIALPFLWAGLVLGLSFIETPLKFTAPGITLPLGLGIGWVWGAFGVLMAVRAAVLLLRFRGDVWLVSGNVA